MDSTQLFYRHRYHLILALAMTMAVGCTSKTVSGGLFTQPATGPGGMEYHHEKVTKHLYKAGTVEEYWIFEPAAPTPASAPLVVFNHGWSVMNPTTYGAWIKHLVRRGNIVVYPRYQENLRTSMKEFTPNGIAAVKAAIRELQNGSHVRPRLNHFAIVGHSMGGAITANMAALATSEGLPQPKAIMCVEPGHFVVGASKIEMPLADFRKIPRTTLMLMVVGADDNIARDVSAKRIFSQVPQIPPQNKDYVIIVSDDHGNPPLVADHHAPTAHDEGFNPDKKRKLGRRLRERIKEKKGIGKVDALDYYGFWKLFDALMDAAFNGRHRAYALGNTRLQRYMGRWEDGTFVKELIVTDQP